MTNAEIAPEREWVVRVYDPKARRYAECTVSVLPGVLPEQWDAVEGDIRHAVDVAFWELESESILESRREPSS